MGSVLFSTRPIPKAEDALGKWSRLATFGVKKQGGSTITFTADTLGQMVNNWSARGDKLAINQDHKSAFVETTGQPAPSLAYFTALAVIADGKVVQFATLDADILPPSPEGLDGLYGFLGQLTPLGQDPREGLANFSSLSPMFETQGEAEDGTPIGFNLIDVGATSTPFQANTAIQFHRQATAARRFTKEQSMNPELMAKLGLSDESTDAEKLAAYAKYAEEIEAEKAEMKKRMDAFEGKETPDEEESEAVKKMAEELGVEDGPKKMARCLASLKATRAPIAEVARLQGEVAALSKQIADAAQAEADKALDAFVADAVANGQWDKDKADALKVFAKADIEAARKSLLPKGAFTLLGRVANRIESQRPATAKPEVEGVKRMGVPFSDAVKARMAQDKTNYETAALAVAKSNPELLRDYYGI